MFQTSEQSDLILPAFFAAQRSIESIAKTKFNPHHKSKYADLVDVLQECKRVLWENGIHFIQADGYDGNITTLTTIFYHTSGQYIRSVNGAISKDMNPQAVGSSITYLRRYSLVSLLGIEVEDDDGNAGTYGERKSEPKKQPEKKAETKKQAATNERPKSDDHHPSFKDNQGRFFAKLKELGVDYQTLKDFFEAKDWPKPSTVEAERLWKMVGWLEGTAGRDEYDSFVRATEGEQGN